MQGFPSFAMAMTIAAYATAASLLLLLLATPARAYRIKGSEDENKPFVPYEKGFVQNVQDPSTAERTRVNHGYAASVLLGDGVGKNRLFSCPQMVGPFDDDDDDDDNAKTYHCRGPEYGTCDRRSGTCFCNEGYSGESCEDCSPTHFEMGGLCHPKRVCPNDCSRAGRCNYQTGSCDCSDHRTGDDCSVSECSAFHRFCTHCNDDGCIECEEGFSVRGDAERGLQCEPCWRFDPRCRDCNADVCTSCIDLLLLSIHRSGRRPQDPPLPIDELTVRELSVTVPFGSQQDDAFYDAEHYFLVDPSMVPLYESAVECHQGWDFDDTITCVPYNLTSHIMCGNYGTITFESPEYAIREDEKQIRLTLRRSGGGVGEVSVSYSIYPMTAGYEDVTSTAYYTANQTVVFRPGQIRASFLVTINDDRILEANETFSIHLSKPTGSARLGTQSRTIVTIIDDDGQKTCSDKTMLEHNRRDLGYAEAGTPFSFLVIAKTCAGNDQHAGGDVMKVEAHKVGAENVPHGFDAPATIGKCDDLDDGSYACDVNAPCSGNYDLEVYQLVPGGLKGFYYTDNYLSDERLDIVRTDAVVNFTWGTGAVTTFGRDFVSVRWEGYVRPPISSVYTLWLEVNDHARLWVDGILLIDSWVFSPTSRMLHAEHDLTALETHELVLEYREITGNATARLLWSSASTSLAAIPSSSLFYKEHIRNSPFSYRVLPASTSAKETMVFGEGLYRGITGKSHSFTIEPKDRFGNFRGWPLNQHHVTPDDDFHATAELIDGEGGLGNSLIPVVILFDDHKMMYEASYVPRTAGVYQLNITMKEGSTNENHIFGSPFLVQTKPGGTRAPESIAFGGNGNCLPWIDAPCPGISHGMAGQNSTFTIEAFDLNRNQRGTGGDIWKVVVSSTLGLYDYHIGTVEDHGNGTYTAEVTPLVSGPNELTISLDDSNVKGSPFRMNVVHGQVVGTSSYAMDEDDVNAMVAMTENVFTIQATDAFENDAIYCDTHPFSTSVMVEGDGIDTNKTRVSYIGGGKYRIHIIPLKPTIILRIKLNGSEIKRSPFNVTVYPGTFSASSSSASGTGVQRARAGDNTAFVIQAKDEGGNIKINDEALFDVRLVLVERDVSPPGLNVSNDEVLVTGSQEFMGNGQYLVNYTCFVSGEYDLHVKDSTGDDITGSPFRVTVEPADMSAPHSFVDGQGILSGSAGEVAEVRVYGMDKHGNFVMHAVETIEMTLTLKARHQSEWETNELNDPVGSHVTKQLSQDSGRGIFVLDFTPKFSGEYELGLESYSPGGLEGSFYSSPDLSPDHLVFSSLQEEVEIRWEDNYIIDRLIGTESHFGAVWNGKLVADHGEEFLIAVECNNGGYASHAIGGQYRSWQSCYPVMTTNITMKANKAINFSLRYKSLEGSAFVVLKWASTTVLMEKIPPRNLYSLFVIGNNALHHPVISPNKVYPPQSIALGDALRNAISGIEHEFLVESRDEYGNGIVGNLLLNGNSIVKVDAFHYQNEGSIQTSILDNKNGTYTIAYNPGTAGIYFLSIMIDGIDIKESPFLLRVKPGEIEPANSLLLGEETIEGITGREIQLEFQTVDTNGNYCEKGGDEILAVLSTLSGDESEEMMNCKADYAIEGLYSIACPAASQSGNYLLHIDIVVYGNAKPIKYSPFQVTIYPGHAVPERTEVIGNTAIFVSEAGLYDSFLVNAKDLFGNALSMGGSQFVARVRGDTNIESSQELIEVVDQGNGKYVFAYRVTHPSTYIIHVSMVTGSGLLGEYFMDETSAKEGVPHKSIVDEQILFNIRRFDDESSFSNIRWMGYINFPHTSIFELELTGIDGHCSIWIGDEMVLATNESVVGSFGATENVLLDIKIECTLDTNRLLLQLFWSSRKTRRQIVPKSHLFSSVKPIKGSPFRLTVIP